jgi:hypothetical protein
MAADLKKIIAMDTRPAEGGLPVEVTRLKSALGLCNYIASHIPPNPFVSTYIRGLITSQKSMVTRG